MTLPLKNSSYDSVLRILREDINGVLCGEKLEWNEFTMNAELGRRPLRDNDVSVVRGSIERNVVVPDTKGNPVRMKSSFEEIFRAMNQIAFENQYHPVREYLARCALETRDLKGSSIGRTLCHILRAEHTPLNLAMLEKFMIGAVARIVKPGTKLDSMLVLVGQQGCLKSTFVEQLFSPWSMNTTIDVSHKDAFQQIQGSWGVEWAEMETLRRAADATATKAFLSSATDRYRPPYARYTIEAPRQCVFLGTTNNIEFLSDMTGNRRFWPIEVGGTSASDGGQGLPLNLERLGMVRDLLWGEAVKLYQAGVEWWLPKDLEAELERKNEIHRMRDPWEEQIVTWSNRKLAILWDLNLSLPSEDKRLGFTTAEVLNECLGKSIGSWNRADENRVASILRLLNFLPRRKHGQSREWSRPQIQA